MPCSRFDNRDGFVTGVVIVARCTPPKVRGVYVDVVYADSPSSASQHTLTLACQSHTSFSLADFDPSSKNRLGYVVVTSSASDMAVSAVALLFNPKGGAHTTIPVSESVP